MTDEKREEMLGDLEAMDAKFEMIGSYPELVAEAKPWDGDESKFADPVAMYLERVEALQSESLQEEQDRKAAEEATPMFSWSLTGGRMMSDEMKRIKADAEKSGAFMKAPNGEPSKLTEWQWLQVRTKAFKDWFGDWERVMKFRAVRDAVMSMPVVTKLSGKEFQSDGVPLTDKVPIFWQDSYQGAVESPELGRVVLDKEGVKSSMGHGIGSLKSAAFYAVPEVIRKGKVFDRQQNWKGRGYDTAVLAAPISIGGTEYVCEVIVEQRPNRQGFYLHEVEVKEKLGNVFKTSTKGGTRQASRSILALRDSEVNSIWKNCSKVVDENGEPLVVYHGTVHGGFRVFDVDGRGKTEGAGAFFTSDKRVAEGYSANFHTGGVTPEVYACFLNIREPEVIDFNGNSWDRVPDRASGYFVHYDNGDSEWFGNKADANFAVSDYDGKAEIEEDWEESPTLDGFAREVREEYPDVDGIIAKNVVDTAVGANKSYTATDFIVASPNQIKSATDNRGTFDGSNPDITYSVTGGKNLAAVHTLSAEKFLAAVELGGMPMPSVAGDASG